MSRLLSTRFLLNPVRFSLIEVQRCNESSQPHQAEKSTPFQASHPRDDINRSPREDPKPSADSRYELKNESGYGSEHGQPLPGGDDRDHPAVGGEKNQHESSDQARNRPSESKSEWTGTMPDGDVITGQPPRT